jgi:acyl CoA:acetate/3-ketoacid CoA transferase beta subunit
MMRFPEKKMTLFELAPGVSIEDLQVVTGTEFAVSESLCQMKGIEE